MRRRSLLLLPLFVIGCAPPPPSLVDQDVSFLVPLDQSRSFLAGSQPGGDGAALLDRALFDQLHALTVTDEPDALYSALATVGVRLDACFVEGRGERTCRPQVRLVLQPVFDSATGPTTRDTAVHLFFSSTTKELDDAVRALSLARTHRGVKVEAGIAGSHPGFATNAWVDDVRAVLLPLLRRDRVVRATAMSVHASNEAWIFSGFEVTPGTFTEIEIPTLAPAHEGHVTSTGQRDQLTITLDPPTVAEAALSNVLEPLARQNATPAQVDEGLRAIERIENPALHNPGTIDCAACHVAPTAKWFLANKSSLTIEGAVSDTYGDSRNLRAFGYFFQAAAISPRVARETSAVRTDFAHRLDP